MQFTKILICASTFTFMSLSFAQGSGDLTVSGTTIINGLAEMGLDCTTNTNGGALITDVDGIVVCESKAARFSEVALFEIVPGPSRTEVEAALAVLERFMENPGELERAYADLESDAPRQEGNESPSSGPELPVGSEAVASKDSAASLTSPVQISTDGAVQAEDFVYGTPRLRTQAIPAALFRPLEVDRDIAYFFAYSYLTGPPTTYSAIAPLYLPQGSQIEAVTCYAYDNDANNSGVWTVSFRRRTFSNTGITSVTFLTIDTVASSNLMQESSLGPLDATNNTQNMQFLQLDYERDFGPANTPNLRFYGCKVIYEVTEVDTP